MNTKKAYYLFLGVLVLMIVALGAILYFSRTFLLSNSNRLVAAKLELYKIDETESAYKKNQSLLESNVATAEALAAIVPSEKDQARAVRELTQIAGENGLTIKAVRFPGSDLVVKKTTGTTSTTNTPSVSQAKPVPGLNNVLGVAVEVELNHATPNTPISTDQVLGFLNQLENNRRNIRVTSINFGSAVDEGKTLKMDTLIFIKP